MLLNIWVLKQEKILFLSQLAIATKIKMASNEHFLKKKKSEISSLSCQFSHNVVVLLAQKKGFFAFFFEEPKWNNLLSFVPIKAYFSVKQEKFSIRHLWGFNLDSMHCLLKGYKNDEASKQSKKTLLLDSEGIRPQEMTFSRKIVQESRKRCVTKYLSSETGENTFFITTCHCH